MLPTKSFQLPLEYRFTVKEVTSFDKSNSPESDTDHSLGKIIQVTGNR